MFSFSQYSQTLPWLDKAHCLLRQWGLLKVYQNAHSEPKGGTQDIPSPKTRSSCGSDRTWDPRHSRKVMGRYHSPSLVNRACWRRVGQGYQGCALDIWPYLLIWRKALPGHSCHQVCAPRFTCHPAGFSPVIPLGQYSSFWADVGKQSKEWRNLVPLCHQPEDPASFLTFEWGLLLT